MPTSALRVSLTPYGRASGGAIQIDSGLPSPPRGMVPSALARDGRRRGAAVARSTRVGGPRDAGAKVHRMGPSNRTWDTQPMVNPMADVRPPGARHEHELPFSSQWRGLDVA